MLCYGNAIDISNTINIIIIIYYLYYYLFIIVFYVFIHKYSMPRGPRGPLPGPRRGRGPPRRARRSVLLRGWIYIHVYIYIYIYIMYRYSMYIYIYTHIHTYCIIYTHSAVVLRGWLPSRRLVAARLSVQVGSESQASLSGRYRPSPFFRERTTMYRDNSCTI